MTKRKAANTIGYKRLSTQMTNKKMHYVTLTHIDDYLQQKASLKKHFFLWRVAKEIFQFGVVFLSVFLFSTILVNANLFYHTMKNVFVPVRADDITSTLSTLSA